MLLRPGVEGRPGVDIQSSRGGRHSIPSAPRDKIVAGGSKNIVRAHSNAGFKSRIEAVLHMFEPAKVLSNPACGILKFLRNSARVREIS